MTKANSTLATQDANYIAFRLPEIDAEEMAELREEMHGLNVAPLRIKAPSGGGIAFEVPNPDDPENPDSIKELFGIIVHHHPVNRLYLTGMEDAGDDRQPDCSSIDGVLGISKQGTSKECTACPLSQRGSSPTGGRMCSPRHRLYFLTEGSLMPYIIEVPPASLKNFAPYLNNLTQRLFKGAHAVVTKITLKKATNKSNVAYSEMHFSRAGNLAPAMAKDMKAMKESLKSEIIRRTAVPADPDFQPYESDGENEVF